MLISRSEIEISLRVFISNHGIYLCPMVRMSKKFASNQLKKLFKKLNSNIIFLLVVNKEIACSWHFPNHLNSNRSRKIRALMKMSSLFAAIARAWRICVDRPKSSWWPSPNRDSVFDETERGVEANTGKERSRECRWSGRNSSEAVLREWII